MPTIEENRSQWTTYDWSQGGHEWSQTWGGTDYLWWGSLYPRIRSFIPVENGLEIAPGYGRVTQYLLHFCKRLTLVDLTSRCIEACKERFSDHGHLTYHVNDGKSLDAVEDGSVDFVLSFDSLVHADADVLCGYVEELSRKLSPQGVGFIHHSNLGAFKDPETGKLPFDNLHWRSDTMSAQLFREYCQRFSLQCIAQELINWGGNVLHDCFSVFTRPGAPFSRECIIRENPGFMGEANALGAIASLYRPAEE